MKLRRLVLIATAIIFLAVIASIVFVFYTQAGASLVMRTVQSASPGTFSYKSLTGRLGYRMRMEGVTLNISGNTVKAGSADLQWHPVYMVFGKLAVDRLELADVEITGAKKEKEPVDLRLPRIPRWVSVFRAWVKFLSIKNIEYKTPDGEPFSLGSVTSGILFDRGVLYADELKVEHGGASVGGVVIVDLIHPGLRSVLNTALHTKAAGLDNLFVSTDLRPSGSKDGAMGTILLKAFAGKKERLRFESKVGLERQAFRLMDAKLTKADNGGTLDANAAIDLSGVEPAFDISGKLTRVNLAPELPQDTSLSGDVKAAGTMDSFQGYFSISNAGQAWKEMALRGDITGSGQVITLKNLAARVIGGTLSGTAEFDRSSRTVSAQLAGTGLNPAKIKQGLSGNINFRFTGSLTTPAEKPAEGSVKAVVHNSTFQNRPLTADVDAVFAGDIVKINTLSAKGSGFTLNAKGMVQERVTFLVRVDDASQVSPGAAGTLAAEGWARWRNKEAAGALTARGSGIAWETLSIGSFNAGVKMPEGYDGPIDINVTAGRLSYGVIRADTMNLSASGTTGDHRISFVNTFGKDRIEAAAVGSYDDGAWRGTVTRMSGQEAAYGNWSLQKASNVRVARDGLSISEFIVSGSAGEYLNVSADLTFNPLIGFIGVRWQNVNLGRADKVTGNARIEGRTSGDARVEWLKNDRLTVKSAFTGKGVFSYGQLKQVKMNIDSRVNWDSRGLEGTMTVDLGNRGRFNASAFSKEPARLMMPGQGNFRAEWSRLDLAALKPLLGDTAAIKGYVSGSVNGRFLPEKRFTLTGDASLSDGFFSWRSGQGEITAPVREAILKLDWAGSSFKGNMRMAFGEYGNARAELTLPLPAKLPAVMNTSAPLTISASGDMRESGFITALFPGMVQETKGQVRFDMTATGTPADPRLNGLLNLRGASAYLPAAGMDLKDVNADIAFNNDRIDLTSLAARSGPGRINITGRARHSRGRITSFEAAVKGDRFQAVNLPELTTLLSPDITITGNPEKITVRGSVLVPEALISEERKENMIKPSKDVVIVGKEETVPGLPFQLDLVTTVQLGDKVAVKAYGIDTRLTGRVVITMTGPDDLRGRGTITTAEGKYDAYGVKLNVQRGNISFNGPVQAANLDILAIRRIRDPERGSIAAGVLVTGNARKPNISLYSRPSMPDVDALSYMVLGRPTGQGGQTDTALIAKAASGLLTGGKAAAIQRSLGLDIDVASKQQGTTAGESIVKVGRYISPKIYVGFGRSMSGSDNAFSIRYRLMKKLDIESTVGTQTGGAIYYRVEFD
jgi:translocation and assembly module TamB